MSEQKECSLSWRSGCALHHTGAAKGLPSASNVSTAGGESAAPEIAKSGKPKKRVSWRAGSLDDVAQASASRAGLATPEELLQQEQGERFTWKVCPGPLMPQITSGPCVHPAQSLHVAHGAQTLGAYAQSRERFAKISSALLARPATLQEECSLV